MMHRNLDRRIEVLVRLPEAELVQAVGDMLDLAVRRPTRPRGSCAATATGSRTAARCSTRRSSSSGSGGGVHPPELRRCENPAPRLSDGPAPSRQEYSVAFRLRPVDTAFYDLFTESAQHLVVGAGLLAEMLADGADRAAVAERMREAEHEADETTHAIVRRVNQTFVTPFDREDIYRLASGLDDVMDMMDEVVDLVLLYEVARLPPELSEQVEVIQQCADLTADGDAEPPVDAVARGVLDRDQPARERRRQATTAAPWPSCSPASSRPSRCSSSRTSWRRSNTPSTRSRASPTSSSRSPSRKA